MDYQPLVVVGGWLGREVGWWSVVIESRYMLAIYVELLAAWHIVVADRVHASIGHERPSGVSPVGGRHGLPSFAASF